MQTKCEESEKAFLLSVSHGQGEIRTLNNIDLFPEHFIDQIEFVKIELRDSSNAAMVYGSCFIPLSSFSTNSVTGSFSISRYGCSPTVLSFCSSTENVFGSLEVAFQKKYIPVEISRRQSLYIRRESYHSTVFNTRYLVECVQTPSSSSSLVSEVETKRLPSNEETFLLQITSDCLILNDLSDSDSIEDRLSSAGSELSLNATKGQNMKAFSSEGKGVDEDGDENDDDDELAYENEEKEIILYENEKWIGFGWQKPSRYPHFSTQDYKESFKFASPIEYDIKKENKDYKWKEEGRLNAPGWTIIKAPFTDNDGWTYASSFGELLKKEIEHCPLEKSWNALVRRRRWARTAIKLKASAAPLQLFEKFALHDNHRYIHKDNWRNHICKQYPDGRILLSCQEKVSMEDAIVLPWDNIKDMTVISPSIVSLTVKVNRFVPSTANDHDSPLPSNSTHSTHNSRVSSFASEETFEEVEMELFISNCPAYSLKAFLFDKVNLSKARSFVEILISSSNGKLSEAPMVLECVSHLTKTINVTENSIHNYSEILSEEDLRFLSSRLLKVKLYMSSIVDANIALTRDIYTEAGSLKSFLNEKILQSILNRLSFDQVTSWETVIHLLVNELEEDVLSLVLNGKHYEDKNILKKNLKIVFNAYISEIVILFGIHNLKKLRQVETSLLFSSLLFSSLLFSSLLFSSLLFSSLLFSSLFLSFLFFSFLFFSLSSLTLCCVFLIFSYSFSLFLSLSSSLSF
jgi:hypothetical protein